jgi:hypothetical protein
MDMVWCGQNLLLAHSLFRWVGIIEANDHLPVVHFSKILVQGGGFGVPDVQISAWLRGKSRNNLAVFGIL